jgi:hypothetical protein
MVDGLHVPIWNRAMSGDDGDEGAMMRPIELAYNISLLELSL